MVDDQPLGEIVNRTARLLRRLADQHLAPFDLSAGYLPVLTALMNGDAMSQKALTRHAGIEQPTMAATLGRMERDGVIERHADPADKRSARFTLTERTRDQAAEIMDAIRVINADAIATVSAEDQRLLRRSLRQIMEAVTNALGDRNETATPPLAAEVPRRGRPLR